MIKTLKLGIDPDLYCYDTGLTFAQDVADQILNQVYRDESHFPRRNNYFQGQDYRELARQIGADQTREIIRRQQQIKDAWPDADPIKFRQYYFTPEYDDIMRRSIPQWLILGENNPNFMLQVSDSGDILPTHCDHKRKVSLFMLLQSDDQETRWYKNTEDFVSIDPLRIPDLDKIEPVISVVMQPRRWYLFNHVEWHSVHKTNQWQKRINIGIDYSDIDAETLLAMLRSHES